MAGSSARQQLLRASAMVTEMAVFIILGLLAGGWLDRKLHTSPLFLLVLSLLAFAVSMVRLLRAVKAPSKRNDPDPP